MALRRRPDALVRLAAVAASFLAALLTAPSAGAILVSTGNGRIAGITLRSGVSASTVSVYRRPAPLSGPFSIFSSNGNLDYNGGPVLHASAPYLVFWDPSNGITSASRTLMKRYFTDVAHDSGLSSTVYAVNRQFTDSTGFADYAQSFSAASQAIVDATAFPARDQHNCPNVDASYPVCVTDAQVQTELGNLIAARALPAGTTGTAPVYFMVLPNNVNECSPGQGCADDTYCAYHTIFQNSGQNILYSVIPMLGTTTFTDTQGNTVTPKSCQADNTGAVQRPNADPADVAIKYMSHEDNETITDPIPGLSWADNSSGNENGDNCNFTGPLNPQIGSNPNAFKPTLGGSPGGTLYDQLINGNQYYIQSEWSNGDVSSGGCEMQPTSGSITPSFTATTPASTSTSVTFDPTASTSLRGVTSESWDFGDGSTGFQGSLATASHMYSSPGGYTVKLTLVDGAGNLATLSRSVTISPPPSAAFTPTGPRTAVGQAVSFDGSASSDPNSGATITGYAWNFGDGSSGSGATTQHSYSRPGTFTVVLTVTDSLGFTGSVSHVITAAPTAAFVVRTKHPATGSAIAFDASSTQDPGGQITDYAWDFGDGGTATGATPRHTFARPGSYTVTVTVTDTSGVQSSISHRVTVAKAARIVKIAVRGFRIKVTVSGPGVVTIAGKRYKAKSARTVSAPIRLSAAQRRRLAKGGKVRLTLAIKFVPSAGRPQSKRVIVHIHG